MFLHQTQIRRVGFRFVNVREEGGREGGEEGGSLRRREEMKGYCQDMTLKTEAVLCPSPKANKHLCIPFSFPSYRQGKWWNFKWCKETKVAGRSM